MKRRVIFGGAFVCLAIITAWVFLQNGAMRSPEQILPDGSRVILRGVSYGKTHHFPTGNFWQRLAVRLLPTSYARRFPALVYNNTNDGPTMVVWVERIRGTPSGIIRNGSYPVYGDTADWQGLFDDSGTAFDKSANLAASTASSFLQGFVFHALPSASGDLHFRFICVDSMTNQRQSTTFTSRNPAFAQSKRAKVVYPLAVQQGHLQIIITGFHAAAHQTGYPPWTDLSFDLFEDSHPATNWELHSLAVLDRKGAVYHPYSASWGRDTNHTGMTFAGGLGTNSPWKLRFALKHVTFASNELCTIRNLPIGDESVGETNLASVPFNGTTLVIRRTGGNPGLKAMIIPPDENYFFDFVNAPQANGHPFDRTNTYYGGSNDTNYSIGFPLGVTNVDLAFGVTRKVIIEAVAQPTPP